VTSDSVEIAGTPMWRQGSPIGLRLPGRPDEAGDILGHDPVTAVLMTWYRNNVLHTVAAPSLIACLVANRRGIRRVILRRLFDAIYPYIARELSSVGPDRFGDWLERLHSLGVIEQRRGTVSAPADPAGSGT